MLFFTEQLGLYTI